MAKIGKEAKEAKQVTARRGAWRSSDTLARVSMPGIVAGLGCAPSVDVQGVYFPGWLVSAVVGLVIAYALVWWMGRRATQRELAQSGLFFCSLTLIFGFLTWWAVFSSF